MNRNTLEILLMCDDGRHRVDLSLSESSSWSAFLGPWPLPCAGAIEEMDAALRSREVLQVALRGCPSACLLPLLWLRTIWFVEGGPEVLIEWIKVEDPTDQRGRQAAGRLACLLADTVRCSDDEQAWLLWGVDASGAQTHPEEAFDLLTNIVDLWDTDLQHATMAADWTEALRRALVHCGVLGHRRVGVYGAGTHTRSVGEALMEPDVEIICLIDDDARRHGERLWGYEIVSREHALELGLDAVVISANSIEEQLWERASVFREAGVATLRLYGRSGSTPASPNTLHRDALEATC